MATISAISAAVNLMPVAAGSVKGVMNTASITLIQTYDVGNVKANVIPNNSSYTSYTTIMQITNDNVASLNAKPINPIVQPNQGVWGR